MCNEERSGSLGIQNYEFLVQVDQKLWNGWWLTIGDLTDEFSLVGPLSQRARISQIVTQEHKEQKQCSGGTFLDRCGQDGDDLVSHIVTGNKTSQWRQSSSLKPKKLKQCPYTCRKMMTFFGNDRTYFSWLHGTWIHNYRWRVLRNTHLHAIQNLRRGKLSCGVISRQDIARYHASWWKKDSRFSIETFCPSSP